MPYLTVQCFILVIVIIQASRRPVDAACLFGTASDCTFQCHCVGGATCDPDTGVCPGECAQDNPGLFTRSGEACQIGNVARDKTTNQTGVFFDLISAYAVDGTVIDGTHTNQYYICAHPDAPGGHHAKWTVDLGGDYVIHNVTVFNTNDPGGERWLADFDVVVMEGPSRFYICGHYTGIVPEAFANNTWRGAATISCDAHPVGRYVIIEKTGGDKPDIMTLCEVVVTGHEYHTCDVGTYGMNCADSCSGRCGTGDPNSCSPNDGSCPGECQQWYTGTNCGVFIDLPDNNGENVTLGSVGSSSVEVVWEQNKDLPEGAETHYGYRISYRTGDSGDTVDRDVLHTSGDTWRMKSISGLAHNTRYDFRVEQYRTWGGMKEYGDTLNGPTIRTMCVAPDRPRSVVVTTQAPEMTGALGSFTVTWHTVNSGCDYITAYLVRYRDQSQSQSTWTNHTASFNPDATSSGEVTPPSAGRYDVTLLVINNAGLSTSSPVLSADLQGDAKLPTASIIQPALLAVLGCIVVALVITLVVAVVRNRGCRGVFNPSPTTQPSTSIDIPPDRKTGRFTAPPSESSGVPSESARQGRAERGYENMGRKDPQYQNPVAVYEDIGNTEEINLQPLQGGQVFK